MLHRGFLKAFLLGAALALAGVLLAELAVRVGAQPLSPIGVPGLGAIIAAALVGFPGALGGAVVTLVYYVANLGYPERFPLFFAGSGTGVMWFIGVGGMTICAALLHARVRHAEGAAAYDNALRDSEAHFRSLTELSSDYYWEQDENFRFVSRISNPNDRSRYPLEQVIGKARWELPSLNMSEADWVRHREDLAAHREFRDLILHRPMPDGTERWISTSGRPMYCADGRFKGYVGVGRDITPQVQAERALRESEERLRVALDGSSVALWDADLRSGRVFLSEAWARIVGSPAAQRVATADELLGLIHPEDLEAIRRVALETMKGLRPAYALEHRVRAANGEWRWILSRGRVTARDPENERALRMIGTNVDITERKRIEEALQAVAQTDPLTGLANRILLGERIRLALARNRRAGTRVALFYLDIDRFKSVNDSLGHAAGDALLRAFAARLRSCVRATDAVARLGGDEFVVLLEDVREPGDAVHVAEKILSTMRAPIGLERTEVLVTTSIGIAYGEAATADEGTLLKRADEALYEAKAAGRNAFRIAA